MEVKTNQLKIWLTALTLLLTTATTTVNAACCDATAPVFEERDECCNDFSGCCNTWRLYIEPMVSWTRWKCGNAQRHMDGAMGGAAFGFDYRFPCSWAYAGFYGQVTGGRVERNNETRLHSRLFDAIAEGRIGGIQCWDCGCNRWETAIYTGIGYEFLNDRHREDGLHSRGNYHIWYIPVAVFANWVYNECWSVGAEAKIMPQISAQLNSHSIKKKVGYSLELPIKKLGLYYFCSEWNVGLTPFYTYKEFSNNEFQNAGVKLSIESRF
jgi:hypothetical protein